MKTTNISSLLIGATVTLTIFLLTFSGHLSTPSSIAGAWLAGLFLVGVICVWRIEKFSKKAKHELPIYQPIYNYIDRIIESEPNLILSKEGAEEIEKIRAKTPNKEVDEVLCRHRWRKIVSLWDNNDTIATYHALTSLKELTSRFLKKEFMYPMMNEFFDINSIKKTIIEKFNYQQGCWYSNELDREPSLEAAYAAIKTAEDILKIHGKRLTSHNLSSILGGDRTKKFQGYLGSCLDKATGGFIDTGEEEPSVSTTGLAIRISFILFNGSLISSKATNRNNIRRLFKLKENALPWDFMLRSFTDIINGKIVKDSKGARLGICTSFFAVSSLALLGLTNLTKDEETKNKAVSFIESCLRTETIPGTGKIKGFVASPERDYGDLMHTFFALKLANILFPNYLKTKKNGFFVEIANLLKSCKYKNGYGYRKGWAPNIYTTCLARQIHFIIKKHNKMQVTEFIPIDALKLITSCFKGRELGFAGYPFESKHLPELN